MSKERLIEIAETLEDVISDGVFDIHSEKENAITEAIKILYDKADEV